MCAWRTGRDAAQAACRAAHARARTGNPAEEHGVGHGAREHRHWICTHARAHTHMHTHTTRDSRHATRDTRHDITSGAASAPRPRPPRALRDGGGGRTDKGVGRYRAPLVARQLRARAAHARLLRDVLAGGHHHAERSLRFHTNFKGVAAEPFTRTSNFKGVQGLFFFSSRERALSRSRQVSRRAAGVVGEKGAGGGGRARAAG